MSYFDNKAEEGRKAYRQGIARDQNPYPKGSAKYWQWSSGWLDEEAFRPRADKEANHAE